MTRDYYEEPFNKRARLSWDNQGWPNSSRDQKIWLNSPPGLARQESGYQEQQLFYRREQIDSTDREFHTRQQRSEQRFESRLDSTRGSGPNPFHFQNQDQNLRPDDLRRRIRDQAGHWSSEYKVAYESRIVLSRTETYSSDSFYKRQPQAQPLEFWGKRHCQEPELGPEERHLQEGGQPKHYNRESRLGQLVTAENQKKDFQLELLKSELQESQRMLKSEKSLNEKLQNELEEAKKKIHSQDANYREMKQAKADLEAKFESQKKELQMLKTQKRQIEQIQNNLEKKIQDQDAKYQEMKLAKADLEAKFESQNQELEMLKIEKTQNEKLQNDLDEAKKKIQDQDAKYQETKQAKADLEAKFESQKKELQMMKTDMSQNKNDLDEAKKKIQDEDAKYHELKQAKADLEAKGEAQKEELSLLARELSDVKATMEKYKTDLTASRKKVAYLEVSHRSVRKELEDTKADAAVLEDQCKTHLEELAKLKTDHCKAISSLEKLLLNQKQEQKRIVDQESYHQELILELNKSRTSKAQLEELAAERDKLQQKLSDVTNKFEDLKRRNVMMNSDLEKHKTREAELDTLCKTQNVQLNEALEDYRRAQQMKEKLEFELSQEKKKFNDFNVQHGKRNSELQKQIAIVAKLINECKSYKAQLIKAEQDARSFLEEKEKLELVVSEEKRNYSILEGQYNELKLEFDRQGTRAAALTIEFESLKTQLCTANDEARRASDKEEKLNLELSDLKKELESLNVENQKLTSKVNLYDTSGTELVRLSGALKTEFIKALQDKKDANNANEKLSLDLAATNKKLEDMSIHNKKLNIELENYIKRHSEQNQVIENFKIELCKAQEDFKQAHDSKEKLELDLSAANKMIEDMSVQNQKLNSELENCIKKDSEMDIVIESYKIELGKVHEDFKCAHAVKEKLELDLSIANKKLEDVSQRLNCELENFIKRDSEKDLVIERFKTELGNAQEDFKHAHNAKEKIELELFEASKSCSELLKEQQDLKTDIELYEAKVTKQTLQNDLQKKELAEHLRANFVYKNLNKMFQIKISDLETITERQKKALSDITAEFVAKERLNQSLQDQNLELQKLLGIKDRELSDEKSQTTSLKKVTEALETELEDLKQQRGKLMSRLDQVSGDHRKTLDKLIDANDQELGRLNLKIADLSESKKFLKAELIKMESGHKNSQKRIVELLNKLVELENEKAKLGLTIGRKNQDIESLNSKQEGLTAKLNQKTEEYEEKLRALQRSLGLEESKKNKMTDFGTLVDVKKTENDVQSRQSEARQMPNSSLASKDDDVTILDQKDDLKHLRQKISSQDDRISFLQKKLSVLQNTLAIKKNEVLCLKRQLDAK